MSAAAATPMNKIERAHQMYREGRYEEALSFYTQALGMARTKPQKIALHSNRAACFLKLHDFKKAAEECTSVLELDRDHTGALMLRAQTLVTLKEYSSALFDVNRLMELNPSSEVYQNLHDRLKTQLLLAPIPEAEEEFEEEEEEEEDEGKEEEDLKGEDEGKDEVVQEVEEAINSRLGGEQKNGFNRNITVKLNPQTPSPKGYSEVQEVKDLPRSEVGNDKKIELQSKPLKAEVAPNETQITKESAEQNSVGWKAIPKPIGHSRLDYSRWDKVVEDDSSGDDDDDDEDYQPQYRFRVKTVGVRSVK